MLQKLAGNAYTPGIRVDSEVKNFENIHAGDGD